MNRRFPLAALALSLALASAYPQIKSIDPEGNFLRGIEMYDDANYIGCIDRLSTVVKSPVASPSLVEQARFYIAMSSLHQGRADALDLLEKFMADYPASPLRLKASVALGDYFYDLGEWYEALVRYDRVESYQLDADTRKEFDYHRAYAMMKSRRLEEAEVIFKQLLANRRYANDALFYIGYIQYRQGRFGEALDSFKKVRIMSDGPTAVTNYYLAQLYYNEKDFQHAYDVASELLSSGNKVDEEYVVEALRIAGESAYSIGRMENAVEYLVKYRRMATDPQPSALYVLGLSQYRLGQYESAVATLAPVLTEDNEMGQSATLITGQAYVGMGNYIKAVPLFDRAFRMNYNSSISETALYNYALTRIQGGKMPFSSTIGIVKRFLDEYPDSPYAITLYEYLVNGYITDNNYEAALASIEEVGEPSKSLLDSKQQILYTLGTREMASGNATLALERFRQAKNMGPRVQDIYNELDLWIGECLYKEGEYANAAKYYQAYLAGGNSQPNAALARYDLGYAYFGMKDFKSAYKSFDAFVFSPGSASSLMRADALNRMGDCLYYESDFSRAATLYERAYNADPAAGDYALFQQASMKGLRRDYKGKIEGLSIMISRFYNSTLVPSALLEMAEAWQELGNANKAIETYNILIERFPTTAQGRQGQILLAIAYLNGGRRDEAAEVYRNVISQYPTSEEAHVAADDLKRIYADNGTLTEYVAFMRSVPDAPEIDTSEIEQIAFDSAEKEYEKTGAIRKLESFITEYKSSKNTPTAIYYIAQSYEKQGNYSEAVAKAADIINRYPHSRVVEDAYLLKASGENALDRTRNAFETYSKLAEIGSNSAVVNAARLGVMRTSRDLGESEATLTAADQLLASSTIGANERDEILFSRAVALEQLGRSIEACATWNELSANPETLYGTKSAFYLAQHYFNDGNIAESRRVTEDLIEANPPHNYWLARAFILISDINRAEGNTFEADEYLRSLRENYPGDEADIFTMIDSRLETTNENE
ncbi:MAG: tetratricopeptide repeat protein [Muribaculaceae bacterium]|nr:tetratricopeptide repeat protein [Muribaculaceae bacterium]